ncbi:MAG: hypothetical protein ACHQD8_03895 [Chitinophagales bacterium]
MLDVTAYSPFWRAEPFAKNRLFFCYFSGACPGFISGATQKKSKDNTDRKHDSKTIKQSINSPTPNLTTWATPRRGGTGGKSIFMNKEKQHQAKHLYFQSDLTKTQIAALIGVGRRTVHYWIRENNWDRLKTSAIHLPAMLAENCYMLINQFTNHLLSENRIMRPVTHLEAETLHKLTLTVKKLKNHSTLNESMEMFAHFMKRVSQKSPALADQISPFIEEYVENWAKLNPSQFRSDKFNEQGFIPIPDPNNPDEKKLEEIAEAQKDFADIMAWEQEQNNTSIEPMIEALLQKEAAEAAKAVSPTEASATEGDLPPVSPAVASAKEGDLPPVSPAVASAKEDDLQTAPASCNLPSAPVAAPASCDLPPVSPAVASAKEGGFKTASPKKRMTFNEMLAACNGDILALHDMVDEMDELSDEEVAHRKFLRNYADVLKAKIAKRPAA